jgi:hypothetical protein
MWWPAFRSAIGEAGLPLETFNVHHDTFIPAMVAGSRPRNFIDDFSHNCPPFVVASTMLTLCPYLKTFRRQSHLTKNGYRK